MSELVVFFFKQKTAYEMRISDWSSDVCSSDLPPDPPHPSGKPSTTKLLREQDRPSPPAMRASRLFPRSCRQCRWQAACQFRRWSACHLCVSRSAGRSQWSSSRANPARREGCGLPRGSGALWRARPVRSEEHTSELQSLMRIPSSVFGLKKKKQEPL